jgi:iron complex outermembrane recepter protein
MNAVLFRGLLPSLLCAFTFAAVSPASAQTTNRPLSDLTSMPLEKLMDVQVTTFSRREERASQTAGAVHVITAEDIRRSGVTSIPEALRLAPGMQVARVDSHQWAISARGFNDVFANKLLVMIDGRSVYTPLFSGVFWDVQDTLMEDIERIEVIRGPGATLWGANAVNGIINIITKSAGETQGSLMTLGAGTEERGFGAYRYGGKLGESGHYRLYAKYFSRDDSVLSSGNDSNDAWDMVRAGFRGDWGKATDPTTFTLQGDAYGGKLHQTYATIRQVPNPFPPPSLLFAPTNTPDRYDVAGGNILGRWTRTFSAESDLRLQAYFDHTLRDTVIFGEDRDTFDLDTQYRFPIGQSQDVVMGAGYRMTHDDVRNEFGVSLFPDSRATHLFSTFVQDEITIVPDTLLLTLGSKFEHNDFTGFEVQPSGRLLWTPHPKHTVWASISRAVRTPSRAEDDLRLNQALAAGFSPAVRSIFGNRDFDSEKVVAYELGYRVLPHARLSLDVATFYNDYDQLRSLEGSPVVRFTPRPPHVGFVVGNGLEGETYGVEIASTYQMRDWWRWQVSYTVLEMQMHTQPGSTDAALSGTALRIEGSNPHHQFQLRSSVDLPHNIELDAGLRHVDSLSAQGIPSYTVMDLRIGWRPAKNWEFSIVGQNLLDSQHPEFTPSFIGTQLTEVQHSVYGKVTWRF